MAEKVGGGLTRKRITSKSSFAKARLYEETHTIP